jgi:hypothetical protein
VAAVIDREYRLWRLAQERTMSANEAVARVRAFPRSYNNQDSRAPATLEHL